MLGVNQETGKRNGKVGQKTMSREVERGNKSMRRFYSIGEVEAITSLSRSTIYRKVAAGTFPSQVPISVGRIGWERRAVDQWCEAQLAAGGQRV